METISKPPPLPPRSIDGHKGQFGRVLIIGGHTDMIGAPALAGLAALRMGAGLVQVATPRSILTTVLGVAPELIGLGLGRSIDTARLKQAADSADAIVIGPGLGQTPLTRARVMAMIRLEKPMVVDADALNILASQKRWPAFFKATAILTPHPGEMKRLAHFIGRRDIPTDDASRIEMASSLAGATGQLIVLKGHRTVVTDARRVFINTTGDSTLSKAGTGDVLSGMLGCLLAQSMDRFDAAALAVNLHGIAGELAGQKFGRRSALARDVV